MILKLYEKFKDDVKRMILNMNREDFDIDYAFKQQRKGPVIYFHDEPDFDTEAEIEEIKMLNNTDQTSNII